MFEFARLFMNDVEFFIAITGFILGVMFFFLLYVRGQ